MSAIWFTWLALLAVGGFLLGTRLGRGNDRRAAGAMLLAVGLIGLWTWLQRNPSVAVNAIPLWLLSQVEGAGAVPLFMLLTGVAWSRAKLPNQKRLTILAAFFGGIFFLQGSLWMLQTTPRSALGSTRNGGTIVMQTQDFSCVAAACATALNRLEVLTTEAEMAELTQTRPGTGSTLIRAMDGLTRRLEDTPWRPELVEPSLEELAALGGPVLTLVKYERGSTHMVTILAMRGDVVLVADPEEGIRNLTHEDFARIYTGQAIRFINR